MSTRLIAGEIGNFASRDRFLGIATLCNNCLKGKQAFGAAGGDELIGQPTEVALMLFAKSLGYPDAREVRRSACL